MSLTFWTGDLKRIGEYRIKALAIDNSGLSTLSAEHVITVKDAEGEKPFAVWRGPEEVTDRSDSYYSYFYYYYGMDEDTKNYLSNDLEWGSLVNLSVEAFDPSFTDNYGQAVEGGIQNVTFWENNPSLGEPTVIGEAMNKYNNIYSIAWKPMYIGQTFVWAEVVDLDQNLIRTDVRSFNIGTNSKKAPNRRNPIYS